MSFGYAYLPKDKNPTVARFKNPSPLILTGGRSPTASRGLGAQPPAGSRGGVPGGGLGVQSPLDFFGNFIEIVKFGNKN